MVTSDGQNSIVVGPGANLTLGATDVDDALAGGVDVVVAQAEVGDAGGFVGVDADGRDVDPSPAQLLELALAGGIVADGAAQPDDSPACAAAAAMLAPLPPALQTGPAPSTVSPSPGRRTARTVTS